MSTIKLNDMGKNIIKTSPSSEVTKFLLQCQVQVPTKYFISLFKRNDLLILLHRRNVFRYLRIVNTDTREI